MKTQLFAVVLGVGIAVSSAIALEADGFGEVQLTSGLALEAQYNEEENTVDMMWNSWKESDNVMWYKMVRSQTNPLPSYPEQDAVHTPNVQDTTWIDSSPLSGKSFYRLCMITYEKERYCSNTVIVNTETAETEDESEFLMCAQVITSAENEETGVCEDFPTPCDVPQGWKVVDSCAVEKDILLSAERENDMVHILWETTGVDTYSSLVLLRAPQETEIYSPFDAGVEVFPLEEEKKEYFDVSVLPRESYTYRICEPDGNACAFFSNAIFIAEDTFTSELLVEPVQVIEETEEGEMPEVPEEETVLFTDLDVNSELGQAVMSYALQGVINGFDDGTFRADKGVTRAEIAKISALARQTSLPETFDTKFCDVPATEWFAPFVAYFIQNEYAKGFESDVCDLGRVFSPHNPVLRSEALKMILEISGTDISLYEETPVAFTDVPEYHWIVPYAKAASALGVIDGDTLSPDEPATRGEVVLMLSRI